MTKTDVRRAEIADRVADYILAEGLPRASLRPLAAAAGMSDRMLLYYFKDKDEIITAALNRVAERLAERLLALSKGLSRSPEGLEAELTNVLRGPEFWPSMCVWLETASRAARGDPLFYAIGNQIAIGFRAWIAQRLAVTREEDRDPAATRVLRAVEGAIVLYGVGVEAADPQPSARAAADAHQPAAD